MDQKGFIYFMSFLSPWTEMCIENALWSYTGHTEKNSNAQFIEHNVFYTIQLHISKRIWCRICEHNFSINKGRDRKTIIIITLNTWTTRMDSFNDWPKFLRLFCRPFDWSEYPSQRHSYAISGNAYTLNAPIEAFNRCAYIVLCAI